jgi:hypothetical protein
MGAVGRYVPCLCRYGRCGDCDRERQGAALASLRRARPATAGWSASGARSISYPLRLPPRLVAPSASCRPGVSLGRYEDVAGSSNQSGFCQRV